MNISTLLYFLWVIRTSKYTLSFFYPKLSFLKYCWFIYYYYNVIIIFIIGFNDILIYVNYIRYIKILNCIINGSICNISFYK